MSALAGSIIIGSGEIATTLLLNENTPAPTQFLTRLVLETNYKYKLYPISKVKVTCTPAIDDPFTGLESASLLSIVEDNRDVVLKGPPQTVLIIGMIDGRLNCWNAAPILKMVNRRYKV